MAKEHKRKRESNVDDEPGRPLKKPTFQENGSTEHENPETVKKSGKNRQVKSERKKKRAVQAQQNGHKRKGDKAGKDGSDTPFAAPGLKQDEIAAGQDFVSLSLQPSAVPKPKRRSPRSIRKENRQRAMQDADANGQKISETSGSRFICFVGNLPYDVTTEQIASHFSKLQPKAIRLQTDKHTGKCKGFAFLEFDDYDRMKTCLKLYHHTIFEPEQSTEAEADPSGSNSGSKSKGRKINVELTAGGGGKSSGRKDKIKTKNKKLNEERARDRENKKKKKKKKRGDMTKGQAKKTDEHNLSTEGANYEKTDQSVGVDSSGIHPSRLKRMRA